MKDKSLIKISKSIDRRVSEEIILRSKDSNYDIFAKLAKRRNYQDIHVNMATTKKNLKVDDEDKIRLVKQVLASRVSRKALE